MCKAHSIDLGKVRRKSSTGRRLSRLLLAEKCPPNRDELEGIEGRVFIFCSVNLLARYLFKLDDMLTVLENYRVMLVARVRAFLEWILRACMHPASVCSFRDIQEWFIVWKCYFANLFFFNNKENDEKLLDWVRTRVDKMEVMDFSSSWRSGVLLCALVDSIVPGSCPRYDLLNDENRIGNSQLAIQLLEKLNIKSSLTAQELADDDADIEKPIKSLLTQLKMTAAKLRLRKAVKNPSDESSSSQGSDFFAKGMGLIFAVKGRKASFNIFRRGQRGFSFVIEIQGPNGTLGSALITHKSIKNQEQNSKLKRQLSSESKKILIEYFITDDMISVNYTPVTSGKHTLNIVSQGQHILRSPYDISVDCNTTEVTAKVVETLFRPKKNALQSLRRRFSGTSLSASLQESEVAVPFPNVEATGKVVARRVIKRTILRGNSQGANIVVHGDDETALVSALKDISNLNPKNREKMFRRGEFQLKPVTELRHPHVNKAKVEMIRSISEISERSSADESSPAILTSDAPVFELPEDRLQAEDDENETGNETAMKKQARELSFEEEEENQRKLTANQQLLENNDQAGADKKKQIDDACNDRTRPPSPIKAPQTCGKGGDENNNPKFNVIHDHDFQIRKRHVQLNIINENPYVPKTKHMLPTYRQSVSQDSLTERNANDKRLLYQMESKSMRIKSTWAFSPEKNDNDALVGQVKKKRTDSREGQFGSGDEGDDRMSEIDGDVKAMPVASSLERFTRFSPAATPDCSTTSGSSNGSEASVPCGTASYVCPKGSVSSQGSTVSELEDAFFEDDIFQQELLQDAFPLSPSFSDSLNSRELLSSSFEESRVSPQSCVVSGNALYCGKTLRLMAFEVRTLLAGEGILSVIVQGPQPEAVLETRVVLVNPGLYRVNYRVQNDGYYVIVVKWADWQVPGSPFLCHVTT